MHYVLSLQNYTPGNPSSVLYIKNLAKDVTHDDFYYIFGKAVRLTLFRASASVFILKQNGLGIIELRLKANLVL